MQFLVTGVDFFREGGTIISEEGFLKVFLNVDFGVGRVGVGCVGSIVEDLVILLVEVAGGGTKGLNVFDVGVEFFEGFGCLPRVKAAWGGGFSGAGFCHDGQGLLEGGHEDVGHFIQAFRHGIPELLSNFLNVGGSMYFS